MTYADAGCVMVLCRFYVVVLCGFMRVVLGCNLNSNYSLSSKYLYVKLTNGQGLNNFSTPSKIKENNYVGRYDVHIKFYIWSCPMDKG